MSIASEIARINGNIAAAYSACSDKGATMPQTQNSANLANTIDSISQGSSEVVEKDVNFYDYDGTLLYSYTAAEAAALSALPALPVHTGLTAQGWNWSLADLQSYVAKNGAANAGAMYITDDGATRLYLTIPDANYLNPQLTLHTMSGSLTVEINGVISFTESTTNNNEYIVSITLPAPEKYPAEYVIGLKFSGSNEFGLGGSWNYCSLFDSNRYYARFLTKVELGNNVIELNHKAFDSCNILKTITIPQQVRYIYDLAFCACKSLRFSVLPNTLYSLNDYAFSSCYSLEKVILPNSITFLDSFLLDNCFNLKDLLIPSSVNTIQNRVLSASCLERLYIPDSVSTIQENALSYSNIKTLDLSAYNNPSALPSLSGTLYSENPSNFIIEVANQAMLNAFVSATNWSNYANRFKIKGV